MISIRRGIGLGVAAGIAGLAWLAAAERLSSQATAAGAAATAAATVPAGQTYTGAKRCAACHFKQHANWKKSKHATGAWENLPAKYRRDAECLKCHVTGYGVAGGYAAGTPTDVLQNLLGVGCEACHGPGSKHEEICKKFSATKKLSPEEEREAKGSIYDVLPKNVCIKCHIEQNHKEHPKYDKQ
jgi:hypothetical protein